MSFVSTNSTSGRLPVSCWLSTYSSMFLRFKLFIRYNRLLFLDEVISGRLCGGFCQDYAVDLEYFDKVQIGAWSSQFDAILPLENRLKLHKYSIFWNPCMHFLVEMTQNLCKASNGTEKIICVSNFKNNVIEVWISKTKHKWFNLFITHVIKSWPVAYHIIAQDYEKL